MNTFLKYCFCLLITLSYTDIVVGQAKDKFETRLDVERTRGELKITGVFINNTDEPLILSYLIQMSHISKNGQITNNQSNAFEALAYIPITLSSINLKNTDKDFYNIKLEVFKGDSLISSRVIETKGYPDALQSLSERKNDLQKPQNDQQNNQVPTNEVVTQKPLPQAKNTVDAVDDIEIDGLIIDETRTKTGRDFYYNFYKNWVPPVTAKGYTITIKELPARGRLAQVTVLVNDNILVKRFLQPRNDLIEMLASHSISIVEQYLNQKEALDKQLENEDQKGSGMF